MDLIIEKMATKLEAKKNDLGMFRKQMDLASDKLSGSLSIQLGGGEDSDQENNLETKNLDRVDDI
jgi:hypothetical protein